MICLLKNMEILLVYLCFCTSNNKKWKVQVESLADATKLRLHHQPSNQIAGVEPKFFSNIVPTDSHYQRNTNKVKGIKSTFIIHLRHTLPNKKDQTVDVWQKTYQKCINRSSDPFPNVQGGGLAIFAVWIILKENALIHRLVYVKGVTPWNTHIAVEYAHFKA